MSTEASSEAESRILSPALQALDAAVRGISGVLDVEQVLQLIVDRVRELVGAQYAALGIVDDRGLITEFMTSGITTDERHAIGELPRGHGLLGLIIARTAHIGSRTSRGIPRATASRPTIRRCARFSACP